VSDSKGYRHIGCFRDDESRTIDYVVSGGDKTIDECHAGCHEYKYFGLQYGQGTGKGECRCGNSRDEATRLGVVDRCDNTGTGGPWANAVYENLDQSALALPKIDVDPLEPNVWEQWYSWYQLHYHQFLGLLCGFLVVLCGLNLSASCQREQDTQYVGVKRVSDTDTECDVEV